MNVLTLNLNSPTGASAYGMPLNEKKSTFLRNDVSRMPRTWPDFVSTTRYSCFPAHATVKTRRKLNQKTKSPIFEYYFKLVQLEKQFLPTLMSNRALYTVFRRAQTYISID